VNGFCEQHRKVNAPCCPVCLLSEAETEASNARRWMAMAEDLQVRIEDCERALLDCAEASGEDVSGGPPAWPDITDWAVQAVRDLRASYDEALEGLL
jgi:hypothetical protein